MTISVSQIEEALQRPAGARFWRCALQVNPSTYLNNYRAGDPVDEDSFNTELVAACQRNGVEVVGIADHGNVDQVDRLRKRLSDAGIIVFPGFETQSTEKIHIVCLYPPDTSVSDLHQHLGALGAGVKEAKTRPTTWSADEIAKRVADQGGICFLAHVTLKAGVLGLKMLHVWKSEHFIAAQIEDVVSRLDQGYQDILYNKTPDYRRLRPMCLIHAKDVAKPEDLDNPTASTLIKMTTPSIEALRQAFLDPDSRVRFVNDTVSADHGRIVAVAWEGGFLDGVRLHLSDNLNAVVGGRGTGKSTVIETIRYAFNLSTRGASAKDAHDQIVAQNIDAGGRVYVQVCSASQLGRHYTIIRQFKSPPEVRDDRNQPSKLTPAELLPGIEIMGHDEILELTKDGPAVRSLIETFVPSDTDEAEASRRELRQLLADNRQQLVSAHEALETLQASFKKLPKLEEQLGIYRDHGIEQKLAAHATVAKERELVKRFAEEFTATGKAIEDFERALPSAAVVPGDVDKLPAPDALKKLRAALDSLAADLRGLVQTASERLEEARTEMGPPRTAHMEAVKRIEQDLAGVIRALPEHGGKSGAELAKDFKRVVEEAERIRPEKDRLEALRSRVEQLREERDSLLARWRDDERARFDSLKHAADLVSADALSGKLRVSVSAAGDRSALKKFLQGIDGVGAKKAEWIEVATTITVHGLVDAIDQGKDALLEAFQTSGLTQSVASSLAGLPPVKRHELEEIVLLPTVSIELNVAPGDQSPVFRPLDQLSTGQRCTAILYILLAKGNAPLIIDQPEDHLDNAFIADLIVEKLRCTKLKRQFLFATHNANIPVLGDAELIAVLKADSRTASLPDEAVGSVDKPEIQVLAAKVLEGGHEAFAQRQRKYGLKNFLPG